MTGYASIDKPWLKYYEADSYEIATTEPDNSTVWSFLEKRLKSQNNTIPALEYFGRTISRSDLIKNVYNWARIFRGMGIREDEVVIFYCPWLPEICYMIFALNHIGAIPYFVKLTITEKELRKECCSSRFAVVFDGMWNNVSTVLRENSFEKVIFVSAETDMPFPLKQIVKLSNVWKNRGIPHSDKYLTTKKAAKLYSKIYSGNLEGKYSADRVAFITSSSGTTVNGSVKGIMDTNRSVIAQTYNYIADGRFERFEKGTRSLVNLPPAASTSINCLLIQPLYFDAVCIIEPRLSEDSIYDQIVRTKPSIVVTTGSIWHAFCESIKKHKNTNLSFLRLPIIGGEGVTPEDYDSMSRLIQESQSPTAFVNGFGLSEMFSVLTIEKNNMLSDIQKKDVNSVGIPYPSVVCGVFDSSGKELEYGNRGELYVKAPTMMKGYYGKKELTEKSIVDGWLHTGDLFEIDKNGILYYYGRMSDAVITPSGETIYLFDIVNKLQKNIAIKYAMVNAYPLANNETALMAHIILADQKMEIVDILSSLDSAVTELLPRNMYIRGYKIQQGRFRSSPTTAKIDRNSYFNELDGYLKFNGTYLENVSLIKKENGQFAIHIG